MALENNTCFYSALNVYLNGCGVTEPYALYHKEFVEKQMSIDKRIIRVSFFQIFKANFYFFF